MPEHWRHGITMKAPATGLPVGNADIVFEVADEHEGKLIGTLYVSRGGIEWRPANHQYVRTLPWERFDAVMRDNG